MNTKFIQTIEHFSSFCGWIQTRDFSLTTVTYGLVYVPYLSLHVFLQLLKDKDSKYPLAIPVLKRGRYIDDVFGDELIALKRYKIIDQLNDFAGRMVLAYKNRSAILRL